MDNDAGHLMGPGHTQPSVQRSQMLFRMGLVRQWPIKPGDKVLEIGCGQGDMTLVLADAVGESGHVTAVDIAPPTYGAPVSLGEATQTISRGFLGSRIEFRLDFDPLAKANAFPGDTFDLVVFAHCSWYFQSWSLLEKTFRAVKPWAKRLCLSEWDMAPRAEDQGSLVGGGFATQPRHAGTRGSGQHSNRGAEGVALRAAHAGGLGCDVAADGR